MIRVIYKCFFLFGLLISLNIYAKPVSISNTDLFIEAPTGWSQQINQQTGQTRFVSPDNKLVIDLNPAKDGADLDGKALVESKAKATETALTQNGVNFKVDKVDYWENNGGHYLFKTYKSNLQGIQLIFAMGFVYLGEYSVLSNSSLPAEISDKSLETVKQSMMSISSKKQIKQPSKNHNSNKSSKGGSSFAYGGVSHKNPKPQKAKPKHKQQSQSPKQVVKQRPKATKTAIEKSASSSAQSKLIKDWTTGYSYQLPISWINSSTISNKFHRQIKPVSMVNGHISSFDRMRTYFKKDLEETYEYFLKNNMNKGKVISKKDLTIGGKPGRILDVEYNYPTVVIKGRLILIECEEFVYQFFMRGPSSFKGKPDSRTGNGYWEKNVLPHMIAFQDSFKPMRSGVIPGIMPHTGYVLVQSNNADLKFELPKGWFSHSQKVKNGKLNLGISSGTNFGNDGVYMRFDSYSKKVGTQHADIETFSNKKKEDIINHPKKLNKVISTKDYLLNGLKAKLVEVHSQKSKPKYIRWLIFAETPTKVVLFEIHGQEKPFDNRDRPFKEVGIPVATQLMKTLSSTRKDKFGSAKTTGF